MHIINITSLSVYFQMFDNLKAHIALQNLTKIREQHRHLGAASQSDESGSEDDLIEDDEFQERLQAFKLLMQEGEVKTNKINYRQILNVQMMNLTKERSLLEEKMLIDHRNHEQEITYLKEIHQREMAVLQAELEKYQYSQKKQIKEEGTVAAIKKENRQLLELHSQSSEISEQLAAENATLKREIYRLKLVVKQKQQVQANFEAQKHIQSEVEKRLKEQVANLACEKAQDIQRKKNLEQTVQKLRRENDDLSREVDKLKMESDHQRQELMDNSKREMSRIEQENRELKRRNQKLEESFIEHLTQTSLNLQQTLKHAPQKTGKNTTLYLQETPIRTRSRGRERQRTPSEEEDPEKRVCSRENCSNAGQMAKLKEKLRVANGKIVELLQQKCEAYRRR